MLNNYFSFKFILSLLLKYWSKNIVAKFHGAISFSWGLLAKNTFFEGDGGDLKPLKWTLEGVPRLQKLSNGLQFQLSSKNRHDVTFKKGLGHLNFLVTVLKDQNHSKFAKSSTEFLKKCTLKSSESLKYFQMTEIFISALKPLHIMEFFSKYQVNDNVSLS